MFQRLLACLNYPISFRLLFWASSHVAERVANRMKIRLFSRVITFHGAHRVKVICGGAGSHPRFAKSRSLSAINLTVNRQSFDHRIHFARLDRLKRVANTSSRADTLSTVSIVHLRDGNLFIRLRRMESSGYRMLPVPRLALLYGF